MRSLPSIWRMRATKSAEESSTEQSLTFTVAGRRAPPAAGAVATAVRAATSTDAVRSLRSMLRVNRS